VLIGLEVFKVVLKIDSTSFFILEEQLNFTLTATKFQLADFHHCRTRLFVLGKILIETLELQVSLIKVIEGYGILPLRLLTAPLDCFSTIAALANRHLHKGILR
jgi:hypothetical protein